MAAQQPCPADELEDALLELVFACACAQAPVPAPWPSCIGGGGAPGPLYRHCPAIPQTCKRWRAVYTQSTVLWQELRLDWHVVGQQAGDRDTQRPALARAARWLAARLPVARRLVLLGCGALGDVQLQQLFPDGFHGPRLREALFLTAKGPFGPELGLLRGCPGLESVVLAARLHPAGLAGPLTLQAPSLLELAPLPCLRSLILQIAGFGDGLAPAVAGLTRLAIRCHMEAAALPPDLLEGLSQLRRLELGTIRLAQFTPRLAQALSQLTHLSCADVLAAQPRRRAGVQLWAGLRRLASLCELRVESQPGPGMPEHALACPGLRGLTLLSCSAAHWPLAPRRYAGADGCVGSLRSLHMEGFRLAQPVPAGLWALLAPALTSLTWRRVTGHSGPHGGAQQPTTMIQLLQAAPVPPEICHLHQLRCLQLEYAQLDCLPAAVLGLSRLTELSLEGNHVASLPPGPYLSGLRRLSLANNALTHLPEGLPGCSSLADLCLAGNPLMVVSGEAARELAAALPLVQRLHLSLTGVRRCGGKAEEAERQEEGLRVLARLLGSRLVMEA